VGGNKREGDRDNDVMARLAMTPSPGALARLAGILYLCEGATSVFGQLIVPDMVLIPGDPSATAARILENETLLRLGVAATLISVAFFLAETAVFASLFRPVGAGLVALFVFFSVMGIGLHAVAGLFEMAPLTVFRSRDLGALADDQRAALAVLFLRLSSQTFNVFLVFFGFRCLALGYLVLRSSFMPRVIGALMMLAGVGYLLHLWPPLIAAIAPLHLILAAPGELSIVGWLLVRGVNSSRWRAQADAARRVALAD
jgi:hypothetical protein